MVVLSGHSFVRKWVLLTSPGTEGGDDDDDAEAGEEGSKSKAKSALGGSPAVS